MKLLIILVLGAAVFAAPCVYDPFSREPSPAGILVNAIIWVLRSGPIVADKLSILTWSAAAAVNIL